MVERGELVERLEKATGGDRELDAEIESIFGEAPRLLRAGPAMHPPCPPFTFSVDAAIALVERVLPGAWWEVSSGPVATLQLVDNRYICADGATPS